MPSTLSSARAYSSASDPGVSDDTNQNFKVGDVWVNTTSGAIYVCRSAIGGAAVWTLVSSGADGLGSDGDKGDITVGGSGTTLTIDNGAVTEAKQTLADNTTHDVSTTKHGYVPKAPNDTTKFLRGDGTWAVPPGGSEAYPVGAIFAAVVSTDPATLLGYGTWSAFAAGRCLVGIDAGQTEFDTVEETGGAKTHTLTTAEMPAHTHEQTAPTSASGGAVGFAVDTNASGADTSGNNATQSAGGGGAHNNLQPYIVVYFWKRTA